MQEGEEGERKGRRRRKGRVSPDGDSERALNSSRGPAGIQAEVVQGGRDPGDQAHLGCHVSGHVLSLYFLHCPIQEPLATRGWGAPDMWPVQVETCYGYETHTKQLWQTVPKKVK